MAFLNPNSRRRLPTDGRGPSLRGASQEIGKLKSQFQKSKPMNASLTPVVIKIKHRHQSTAETVFDAWTQPALARQFLFATEGGEAVDCEIDAKTAGTFKISERRAPAATGDAPQTVEHIGHFIELIRPTRLVFSFNVPAFSSEETVVAIDLTPLSIGGCDVILTHSLGSGVAARQAELQTEKAWQRTLQLLDGVLAT